MAFRESGFVSLLDVRLVEETSGQNQTSAGTRTLRRISLDFYQDTPGNIRLQPFDNKRGQVRCNSQAWPDALQEEFMDQVNWLATDPAHLGRTLFGLTNSPDKPHRREIVATEQS